MPEQRPNVLLICVDHWSGLLLQAAGHPTIMAPTIDALCRNGTYFRRAYSACPTCVPARRTIMTGLSPRAHQDRKFSEHLNFPGVPTLAQCFRDGGYQAYAVGKLHVYPQRSRIGFDDVILCEEGRHHLGMGADDWEQYIADRGYAGQEFGSGLCSNDYLTRAWQLPEDCHPTNWAAREMSRTIHRRDPNKPAFWYLSFIGPHPPVWPLQTYMDLYRDVPMDQPVVGDWARDMANWPYGAANYNRRYGTMRHSPPHAIDLGRRAFYACVTHLDHQIRLVLGLLREQKLIENTIVMFIADHGDMLGDHGMWAKAVPYEGSARVPFIIQPVAGDGRLGGIGAVDDRIVELRDVMPTLLDLCGLPIPAHVEGLSLLRKESRSHLLIQHWEGVNAIRAIRDERYKLVYSPAGNRFQLFDLETDPRETRDLADDPAHAKVRQRLTQTLISELYGSDLEWVKDGRLVGMERPPVEPVDLRGLSNQRGLRFM